MNEDKENKVKSKLEQPELGGLTSRM